MLKEQITVKDVCRVLNEMLKVDRDCVENLFLFKVKCNKDIAEHETIQVGAYGEHPFPTVGFLGVLNGFFGIDEDGWGALCMVVDKGKIIEFKETPETELAK